MQRRLKERMHTPTLAYAVRRRDPELVGPAAQTPRETKLLSDLDDAALRLHMSLAFFYRGGEDALDPVGVIRWAVGKALVHYYPLAGRLREIQGRKLAVDCTGEGVLFVEADADVQLADLEAAGLRPPFPGWDRLLFDVEGSSGMLNCPLILIQVTRMLCGGFVFAIRHNHTICDGMGIAQFVNAVSELARGLPSMTVMPVWSRELLQARSPPMSSLQHCRFDQVPQRPVVDDMVVRSFIFTASDIAAIKKSLLRATATTFEALAAFIWRARTTALHVPTGEDAPLAISTNFRGAARMSLPAGYYGNVTPPSTVVVDAAGLRDGSLDDAVSLVQLAKASMNTHYFRSVLVRQWFQQAYTFYISDARRLGLDDVDFGWGEPVMACPADTIFDLSFFITIKDGDGEDAVAVPIVLPQRAMHRFTTEVERLLVNVKPITSAIKASI